ncbi:MAG: hypothetical protein INR65_10685 [Gluconacetobacter diazotrophicus]|nr:hypothetical protein [Gluconacetobacter diazotrophicus]
MPGDYLGRELIVVRTHFYNHSLDLFVQELETRSGRKVVIAADETNGPVAVPPSVSKVTVSAATAGLPAPPDAMWRCGDYNLYAVAAAHPDTQRFWLVEPDVRIHDEALDRFFDGTAATAAADFVTPWFVQASPEWMWFDTMRPFSSRIHNCMLQAARFSRQAIAALEERRREMAEGFGEGKRPLTDWPNDEAFVGATLVEAGMAVATFAEHAPDHRLDGSFTFLKPTSLNWLRRQPADRRLYHPVVEGDKFIKRANLFLDEVRVGHGGEAALAREFDETFLEQIRAEGGDGAMERFGIKLRNAALAARRAG